MISPTLQVLIGTNRTLEKRRDTNAVGYYSFLGILSAFIVLIVVGIFYEGTTGYQNIISALCYLIFFVMLADISLVFMKYRRKAAIEPLDLRVYPLTRLQKFYFFLYLLVFDYKITIYATAAVGLLIFFFYNSFILNGLISFLLWPLLAVTLAVWMLTLYQLLAVFNRQIRDKLMQIFIFIYLAPTILTGIFGFPGSGNITDFLIKIPISGQGASVLYGLLTGDNTMVLQNFGILLLTLVTGLTAYRFSPSNY